MRRSHQAMSMGGPCEDVARRDWAVHSWFICSKKELEDQTSLIFFEQMNNLRTVTRLGVDKFISSIAGSKIVMDAYELAYTLRRGIEEEDNFSSPFRREKQNILRKTDDRDRLHRWQPIRFLNKQKGNGEAN